MNEARLFLIVLTICLWIFPHQAFGYPDFISYGYSSCLTCHNNAAGGGGLSDYGRALWASEIAARPFWSKKTDEQLGERSGFLGRVEALPFWFRPFAKYRGIYLITSPGEKSSVKRWINMQMDVGSTVQLDREGRWLFSGAIGYVPTPQGASPNRPEEKSNVISREWYIRRQTSESSWLYAGLLDKVYGLRIADHTAFARRLTLSAQNDQGHGVVWYKHFEDSDLFIQLSAGNLKQAQELRESGGGLWYETGFNESWRIGTSFYYGQNDYASRAQGALFTRIKTSARDSILLETGVAQVDPKNQEPSEAFYTLLRGMVRLARGYNFMSQLESQRRPLVGGAPTDLKWGFGFFLFPMQRLEIQTQYVITRTLIRGTAIDDAKALQIQIHFSL